MPRQGRLEGDCSELAATHLTPKACLHAIIIVTIYECSQV